MSLIVHTTPIPEASSAQLSLVLVDEFGVPLTGSLTTLALTYYDKATEAIINARDSQNALNLNNVTYGVEALGSVVLTFIAASKTIRRVTGNWLQSVVGVGSHLTVAGTVSNNGTYTVTKVTQSDLTVSESVVGEVGVTATLTLAGKIIWTLQPADTVIVDSRKEREDHIVLFVWSWAASTKSGAQEIQISVENFSLHP